jgi:heme exporter protein D
MTAGHFIFIPAILLVGVVIGWILGSRAARDAYLAELRRREERAARQQAAGGRQAPADKPSQTETPSS